MGKTDGNILLGRPMRRWEDNLKMEHQDVDVMALIGSIWIRTGTGDGHI
jgi:hypothetical protein